MKTKVVAVTLVACLALSACITSLPVNSVHGSGKMASEERPVSGITSVTLTTLGDLTITIGDQEKLSIEAEDNLLPYIETKVTAGELVIKQSEGMVLQPSKSVHYNLTVKKLESLTNTSSGNIETSAIESARFSLTVSSSGNIHLAGLIADDLTARISSSGNAVIDDGVVDSQNITVSSSGNYIADGLKSSRADIRVTSSGNALVWVTGSLTADLTSSGNVEYYGQPEVDQTSSSSGRVISNGDK